MPVRSIKVEVGISNASPEWVRLYHNGERTVVCKDVIGLEPGDRATILVIPEGCEVEGALGTALNELDAYLRLRGGRCVCVSCIGVRETILAKARAELARLKGELKASQCEEERWQKAAQAERDRAEGAEETLAQMKAELASMREGEIRVQVWEDESCSRNVYLGQELLLTKEAAGRIAMCEPGFYAIRPLPRLHPEGGRRCCHM